MKVCEMIEMAKNNDIEARYWLDLHYEPIVRENIERKYGTLNAEEFVELLPTLIDYYFDNNIKDRLDNFLMKKAKVLYAPKKQRILIGSLAPKEEEKLNFVVNHYALKLYEGIKSLNTILSDDELNKYCFILLKDICTKQGKTDFRTKMIQYLVREIDYYKENEEILLQKYIIYVGLTDKIYDYFHNKYEFVRDLYKNPGQRIFAYQNYDVAIRSCLINIKKPTKKLSDLIRNEINKLYEENKTKSSEIILDYKENKNNDVSFVYNTYAHIKELIFNKFKGQVILNDDELKQEIQRKYKDYVSAYVNGKANSNTQRYLNTRLTDYFKKYLKNPYKNKDKSKKNNSKKLPLTEEQSMIAKIEFDEYRYLIDRYLNKINDVSKLEEAKEKLEELYDELYEFYCEKTRKIPIKTLIMYELNNIIKKINSNYVDDELLKENDYDSNKINKK